MKKFALGLASVTSFFAITVSGANAAILNFNWEGTFFVDNTQRTLSGKFSVDDANQQADGSFLSNSLQSFTLDVGTLFPQLNSVINLGEVDVAALTSDGQSSIPLFNLQKEGFKFAWSGDTGTPNFFGFGFAEASKRTGFLGTTLAGFGANFATQNGSGSGDAAAFFNPPGSALDFEDGTQFYVGNVTVSAPNGGTAGVPEPTTMLGLGLAGAGMAVLKKRNAQKQVKATAKASV